MCPSLEPPAVTTLLWGTHHDRAPLREELLRRGDSRMKVRWLLACALAAGLLLTALGASAQDSKDKKSDKKKEPPDPPRTGQYMNQLRLLFDTWDLDKDGYLDKQE